MKPAISARAQGLTPSSTMQMAARARVLRSQGIRVIDFGIGEPFEDTPLFIQTAGIDAITAGKTRYAPTLGTPTLITAIQEKFRRENNISYAANEIVVSSGAKHALYALFLAVLNPGDEVLIPVPYWVSYTEQIRLVGGVPVLVPTTNDRLDIETIKKAMTPWTKMLVLNSPNNPSGACIDESTLQSIATLCKEKNVLVVSDEVYEHYWYERAPHSIVTVDPSMKERTIIVNSVSKPYAMTGWRVGYAAGPAHIIKAMADIQSQTTSGPATMCQEAAAAALANGGYDFGRQRMEYKHRRDAVVRHLSAIEGLRCPLPTGAFYAFPSVASYLGQVVPTAAAFAERLLEEEHVVVVPGEGFGDGTRIRISYATTLENIEEGMMRLGRFCKKLRSS